MRRIISAALLALIFSCAQASADTAVVATCGTPPATFTVGSVLPDRMDVNGNKCVTGTVTTAAGGGIGITPTDRTIASASGSSQQIMAANATRHSLLIVNTGNANCGVNPTGGTAVIGGAGTITLGPLGSYSPRVPTLTAVTVICTAGQPIYADEN